MLSLRNMPQYLFRLLVPAGLQPLVFSMRARGQHPCVRVRVPLYGLQRAGFDYEATRDGKFTAHDFVQDAPSVWHGETNGYRCGLGGFVDDHALAGHVRAVLHFLRKMLADGPHQLNYGDSLHRMTDLLGLEFAFVRVGRWAVISISQLEYGRYRVGEFEATHGALKVYAAAGCAIHIGKPGDPEPDGRYKTVAPKFVMAGMYAARMSTPELLFPCVALSRRFEQWSIDDDRRLVVLYGRWKGLVYDVDPLKLRLRVHIDDIKPGFVHDGACDSDHAACPYSRRSTSGQDILLTGAHGSLAMLEANCKTQPGIASSSGAAESRSFHDAVSFDDLEVQEQIDIVKSVAPQLHAAGAVLRRAFIPSLHLLESLKVPIRSRRLRIDATTALVAGGRGYSKLLMHLEKTLGVSVAFLADAVRKLGIDLAKAGTEENESDLMTKVLPAVKVALCNSRLGVMRDSTLDQILTAPTRG